MDYAHKRSDNHKFTFTYWFVLQRHLVDNICFGSLGSWVIHFGMVDLEVPVHRHHDLVTVTALLLLHLLPFVSVCNVKIQIEHIVGSVVTKLAMLVLDL